MSNLNEETIKEYEPICSYGKIYLLTDDGVFYSYEHEGDNTDNAIVLFEIDSDVVSFSSRAYVKSNGEVYTFDEDNKSMLTDKYPEVDMSKVLEVVYDWGI